MSRRWLAGLVALVVSALLAAVLGAVAATECPGEFGKFGTALLFAFLVIAAGALLIAAAVLAILRRATAALVVAAVAIGALAGFWLGGTGNYLPSSCPPMPPETIRETSGSVEVALAPPLGISLAGPIDCSVDIARGVAVTIQATLTDPESGYEVTLFGLPAYFPPNGPLDGTDVIVFDGTYGWGYRPTTWTQVVVAPLGPLSGRTTLVDLPILEDAPPADPESAIPKMLTAVIDWRCDPIASAHSPVAWDSYFWTPAERRNLSGRTRHPNETPSD